MKSNDDKSPQEKFLESDPIIIPDGASGGGMSYYGLMKYLEEIQAIKNPDEGQAHQG